MNTNQKEIRGALDTILKDLGIENVEYSLDIPTNPSFGDYSTNVALIAFAGIKNNELGIKNSLQLAEHISHLLTTKFLIPSTDRIHAVTPGFINFWISKDHLLSSLTHFVETEHIARSAKQKGKKVMVEYTDPNPFKVFHIGHLIPNIVGEAICNLLESQGAEVKRACYQGDVGLHVAKALWGIRNQELGIEEIETKPLDERIKILGQAYALGNKVYEEDESSKKEIDELNKKVYEKDVEVNSLYQKGRAWSLEYFETIYKRLGTKFDYYYFESEVGSTGSDLVMANVGKVFKKSEGAVIFEGEKYGLHNRVFINSLGLPTYEAKELGLAPTKYKDYPYDLSIIVTGNEINEYFKVLLKALSLIRPDLASKTLHLGHGMLRLKSGKMSSRTGNVITGEWLLDETKRLILENFKDMDEKTAEQVAVGSVKYAMLKNNILESDVVFDFHETINMHGNTAAYLQYTYVRTNSILKKAEARNEKFEAGIKGQLQEKEEIDILRLLVKFPEIVEQSADHFTPHVLANYLFDLSQLFNLFYQKHQVLPTPVIARSKAKYQTVPGKATKQSQEEIATPSARDDTSGRIILTRAVGKVLKEGLGILGIETPDRM